MGQTGTAATVRNEYCNRELFNATCAAANHVILMTSAYYGRMRVGRCVKGDYGILGCQHSMLTHLDAKCSGRQNCQLKVPDDVMHESAPCPSDLTSYLEASYECIEGLSAYFLLHFCMN